MPAVCWLKVTDYMHGWMQWELGSEAWIRQQRVVCVQHLKGAKEVLRMETVEDMMEKRRLGNAMSGTRKNCFAAGLKIDAEVMREEYGVSQELMQLFVPIECPKLCLTKHGVLRPWTLDVCFGKEQALAMQRLLRAEFWKAVETFDRKYAEDMGGHDYPAREMVEEFCKETKTADMYAESIRREWQRRLQRGARDCV